MLSVDDARARLLNGVEPLAAETVVLAAACGRWLAAPVSALLSQPPFAASAMDGYAIRWADRGERWRVLGEAAAGRGFVGTVSPGDAVRIFTGAPLPAGADTVAVQEEVARDGDIAWLSGDGPPQPGSNIRPEGLDFMQGRLLARHGTRVTAARLGLFAAAGHGSVSVHRRPRVVLLATGDELVPPGVLPGPDQIVSSNGVMLAALCAAAGAEVCDAGIVADRSDTLRTAILAAADADVLVTIGGASVGDHDLVLPVLKDLGADIDFWKVAMKPGKPMLAGRLGGQRILGLPGNPVSAFVTATQFVLPLLRRLAGAPASVPPLQTGTLAMALPANGNRRDHLRAGAQRAATGWLLHPAPQQDSAMLQVLADAEVLIVREVGAPAAIAGDSAMFLPLDSFEDVA